MLYKHTTQKPYICDPQTQLNNFFTLFVYLNNWVMHPVARVSIKYWKTSVRNTVFQC
jgi:hypothetical protein